jgi:hypothetical protein
LPAVVEIPQGGPNAEIGDGLSPNRVASAGGAALRFPQTESDIGL